MTERVLFGPGGATEAKQLPDNHRVTVSNQIKLSRSAFGELEIAQRINQGEIGFYAPLANLRINAPAATGSGSRGVDTTVGLGYVGVGAGDGHAEFESIKPRKYRKGFGLFDRWTQRIEGFSLLTDVTVRWRVRRNGADSTLATRGVDWLDNLVGAVGSTFTRAGVVEAIDLSKGNVFESFGGWLGFAPYGLRVLRPDAIDLDDHHAWTLAAVSRYPNANTVAFVPNPNLPFRTEITKASGVVTIRAGGFNASHGNFLEVVGTAGANPIRLETGSWAWGIVGDPTGVPPSEKNGAEHIQAAITVAGASTPVNTLMQAAFPGRTIKIFAANMSVASTVSGGGAMALTDGNGGTAWISGQIAPGSAVAKTESATSFSSAEPLHYSSAIYFAIAGIGSGNSASASFVGVHDET